MPAGAAKAPATASRRKLSPRTAGAVVIGALILAFALSNGQTVEIHWLVRTTRTPLIVVIAVCGLLGFGAGWMLARRSASRKSA